MNYNYHFNNKYNIRITMSEFQEETEDEISIDECEYLYFSTVDGKEFDVPFKIAKVSKYFQPLIEDCAYDENEKNYIPLGQDIDSDLFIHILNFMEHYSKEPMVEIPKPINSTNMISMVGDWYGTFITSFDEEMLMKIINASNFLYIQPLLDLGCAQVATMIRQKTPDEIRDIFIVNNEENKDSST